jgi:subtilase family serine protease
MRHPTARFAAAGTSVALLGLSVLVPSATAAPSAKARPFTLRGSSPSWTAKTAPVADTANATKLSLTVMLRMRNQASAEALAKAVSTPGTAQYGKYISTTTYDASFAPTDAQVTAVHTWLAAAGLTVTSVASNHRLMSVSGTVAEAEKAFGTTIANYQRNGKIVRAPESDLVIPTDLASVVTGVSGIATETRLNKPSKLGIAPPPDAFVNATPCSTYWAQKIATTTPKVNGKFQPYSPCGYVPAQLRGAYGLSLPGTLGFNGKGTTIAIVDAYAAPTIRKDANTYAVRHGGQPFAPGQFKQSTPDSYSYGYEDTVNGNLCRENGWYGEETLDVEAVHGVAPGANIFYKAAASCNDADFIAALNDIVANHRADIITNSWGNSGDIDPVASSDLLQAYNETFIQAALQGIGVFFSSGDNGDELFNTGTRQVDFPASDPWVTAVGGTSLAVGKHNNYEFETGWGTTKSVLTDSSGWNPAPPGNYVYGAGGGVSKVFIQPWYQQRVVPDSISNYFGTGRGRAVPDIATVADPNTGFLVGETQTFPTGATKYSEYRIGGTSLASPVMAAIEAIADQAAGHHHGFANPAIYQLAGSGALHDVVSPATDKYVVRQDFINGVDATGGLRTSLRGLNQTGTLVVQPGYDDVTGVGSPTWRYLFRLGGKNFR